MAMLLLVILLRPLPVFAHLRAHRAGQFGTYAATHLQKACKTETDAKRALYIPAQASAS
jgi:hypothetical protein